MVDSEPSVYQFRIFVRGISPVIWRRLLFRDDQTLADVHHALQIVLGWSDYFLHRFLIRGRIYTIPRIWGTDYTHVAQDVSLKSLNLRFNERFVYEYNFFDEWQVEVRLEKHLISCETKIYPTCIGGKRAGPLEDCGGPWTYLALRDEKYHPIHLLIRFQEIIDEADDDTDYRELIHHEFPNIDYWLTADKFDRCQINHRLKQYAIGDDAWRYEI